MASEETIQLNKSQMKNGIYVNPWPNFQLLSTKNFLAMGVKYAFSTARPSLPVKEQKLNNNLPVLQLDSVKLRGPIKHGIQTTWLGHASLIIQMEGLTILTDPVFSDRCSPSSSWGPKRYRQVPSTDPNAKRSRSVDNIVQGLGVSTVDVVLIGTNHYDHLDVASVRALHVSFPNIEWLVPAGVDDWLKSTIGSKNIKGFQWWEKKNIKGVPFTFVPAKYWSSRGIRDKFKTLWGSWCIGGKQTTRFFFASDTGFCNQLFQEIGKRFDGFDCAALPIGSYEPRDLMWPQHINPKEAVEIHLDLRSKQSIGVRWGTFPLGYEYYMAPKETLIGELEKRGMDPNCFITLRHGETKHVLGNDRPEFRVFTNHVEKETKPEETSADTDGDINTTGTTKPTSGVRPQLTDTHGEDTATPPISFQKEDSNKTSNSMQHYTDGDINTTGTTKPTSVVRPQLTDTHGEDMAIPPISFQKEDSNKTSMQHCQHESERNRQASLDTGISTKTNDVADSGATAFSLTEMEIIDKNREQDSNTPSIVGTTEEGETSTTFETGEAKTPAMQIGDVEMKRSHKEDDSFTQLSLTESQDKTSHAANKLEQSDDPTHAQSLQSAFELNLSLTKIDRTPLTTGKESILDSILPSSFVDGQKAFEEATGMPLIPCKDEDATLNISCLSNDVELYRPTMSLDTVQEDSPNADDDEGQVHQMDHFLYEQMEEEYEEYVRVHAPNDCATN